MLQFSNFWQYYFCFKIISASRKLLSLLIEIWWEFFSYQKERPYKRRTVGIQIIILYTKMNSLVIICQNLEEGRLKKSFLLNNVEIWLYCMIQSKSRTYYFFRYVSYFTKQVLQSIQIIILYTAHGRDTKEIIFVNTRMTALLMVIHYIVAYENMCMLLDTTIAYTWKEMRECPKDEANVVRLCTVTVSYVAVSF
jgi:hypothetical protein